MKCVRLLQQTVLELGEIFFYVFFKTVTEQGKDLKGVTGFYFRMYLYLAGKKIQINSSQYLHVSITFVLAYP